MAAEVPIISASGGAWRGAAMNIRRAATSRGRTALGCFPIEGTRLHERALRAGAEVALVVVSHGFREAPTERTRALLAELERADCPVYTAPDEEVRDLIGGRSAGEIVGLVRLPPPRSLAEMLAAAASPLTLLVAVEVLDPGNAGALVRTGQALGAAAFVGVGCTDAHHPKAVRTSMGSVFKLPVIRLGDPRAVVDELRGCGVFMLAAVSSGGTSVSELGCGASARALFVGSEAAGLPDRLVAELDARVTIPMTSGVDSLSLNAATAVILHELRREASL